MVRPGSRYLLATGAIKRTLNDHRAFLHFLVCLPTTLRRIGDRLKVCRKYATTRIRPDWTLATANSTACEGPDLNSQDKFGGNSGSASALFLAGSSAVNKILGKFSSNSRVEGHGE